MKRVLPLLLMAFSLPLRAEFLRFTLYGGSATLAMSQPNEELDKQKSLYAGMGLNVRNESRMGIGYFFDVDADFRLAKHFSFGPRFEWMEAAPGGMEIDQVGGTLKLENAGRALPLLLGLHYDWMLPPKGLRLQASVNAGAAFGAFSKRASRTGSGAYTINATDNAWNACAETEIALDYYLLGGMTAQVGAGYLSANFPTLNADFSGYKGSAGIGIEF